MASFQQMDANQDPDGANPCVLFSIHVSTAGWGDLSRGVHVRNDGPLFELLH